MLKSQSTALFGVCLVGVLGLVSASGCGGENSVASIEPPKSRPSEYAAREAADKGGLVKSGGADKDKQDSGVMARRRAAAQGGR